MPWTGSPVQEHTVERERRSGHPEWASGIRDNNQLHISRTCCVFKDSSKGFSRFLVGFGDEVRIHVECRAWIPMAKPAGDCSHVDARREKTRRYVMPKIVQADAGYPRFLADPTKRSRSRIRMPWHGAVDGMTEDKALGCDGS
jgi:hypothetical protein